MDDMEAVLKRADLIEEDIDIVEECKLGDRNAFRKLVKKHQGRVYSIAFRMLQNQEEAKDATQDVFFAVYRSIKRFRGDSKLSTWIYRIVVNSCINKLKSKKRAKISDLGENNDLNNIRESETSANAPYSKVLHPGEALERKNLSQAIEKEILKLPQENRVIVIMRDIEGLSYEEIGNILNLPDGTVKSRLHRGRLELKKKLKKIL